MNNTGRLASPHYVQTSLAGAMALGFRPGQFYRDAYPGTLNLLLTYPEGCQANCSYCGLARERVAGPQELTFIRVKWPTYDLGEIGRRLTYPTAESAVKVAKLRRICVSMVTHPQAMADCLTVVRQLRQASKLPISVLVSPTVLENAAGFFTELKAAGVDRIGVAIDAATPELFAAYRGIAVRGPHQWEHYWHTLAQASAVFGRGAASIHLVVGLGETEQEMALAIDKAVAFGAQAHLFSFCPEPGSALAQRQPPPLGQYRRMQLAAYLLNRHITTLESFHFNQAGKLSDFGRSLTDLLGTNLAAGRPFMTGGCPDSKGCVACNRPFGNERPGPVLRNYPVIPDEEDILLIKGQIGEGLPEGADLVDGC